MEVARYWRTTNQRYRLTGETDNTTGQAYFSARERRNTKFTQFSGRGEVYSFTVIHAPPEGFAKYTPYMVALVRLAEGPLVTAQLTDVDEVDVRIGMPVEMVTRALREDGPDGRGMLVYGYKFRPAWGVSLHGNDAQSIPVQQPEPSANGKVDRGENDKQVSELAVFT